MTAVKHVRVLRGVLALLAALVCLSDEGDTPRDNQEDHGVRQVVRQEIARVEAPFEKPQEDHGAPQAGLS